MAWRALTAPLIGASQRQDRIGDAALHDRGNACRAEAEDLELAFHALDFPLLLAIVRFQREQLAGLPQDEILLHRGLGAQPQIREHGFVESAVEDGADLCLRDPIRPQLAQRRVVDAACVLLLRLRCQEVLASHDLVGQLLGPFDRCSGQLQRAVRLDQLLLELFQLGEDGIGREFFGARIGLLHNAQACDGPEELNLEFFDLHTAQIEQWGTLFDHIPHVDIDLLDAARQAWGDEGHPIRGRFHHARDGEHLFDGLCGHLRDCEVEIGPGSRTETDALLGYGPIRVWRGGGIVGMALALLGCRTRGARGCCRRCACRMPSGLLCSLSTPTAEQGGEGTGEEEGAW